MIYCFHVELLLGTEIIWSFNGCKRTQTKNLSCEEIGAGEL